MPRMNQLRVNPADVTAGRVINPQSTGPKGNIPIDQPLDLRRSPVLLASLPGLGSGPDAVVRQFNGGRSVPKQRILVP